MIIFNFTINKKEIKFLNNKFKNCISKYYYNHHPKPNNIIEEGNI